jgi:hypothetical protein
MGSTKMCLGTIHLVSENDGSGKGQTRKKEAGTFVAPEIRTLCTFQIFAVARAYLAITTSIGL